MLINASPIVVVNSEIQKLCELSTQMVFGANTGFGMNTVCELFPHIHTEGFHCVCQGLAIFTTNSCAVCQPNAMQICSGIVANSHRILCVKALREWRKLYLYETPMYFNYFV